MNFLGLISFGLQLSWMISHCLIDGRSRSDSRFASPSAHHPQKTCEQYKNESCSDAYSSSSTIAKIVASNRVL